MKNYHFGVDAHPLCYPLTGVVQYTHELLKILPQLGHRWTLYSHKPLLQVLPEFENARYIITGKTKNYMKPVLWSQSILPLKIHQDKLDAFWSPRNRLPLLGNKNLPMIVTVHDLVYKLFPDTVTKGSYFLESFLLPPSVKRAKKIITVSHTTARDLHRLLAIPHEKIAVAYPGIRALCNDVSSSLEHYGINKKYILFIGTQEPRKNLSRLLVAYRALPEILKTEFTLVLIGGKGWGKENLEMSDAIFNLGHVDEILRSTLLRKAHVLAMPSLYEGFGSPVVEAMQAGIPVLTSRQGATAEIAENAALLINPYDVNEITQGLQRLLVEENLRADLIKKGLEQSKKFSWEETAKIILTHLIQVAESAPL